MTETPRLNLPLLEPGQAQKEMTHNEALARLDLLVHGRLVALAANVPPVAPAPGQCWVIGSAPQGVWADHSHAIAGWTTSGWHFVAPQEGMRLWIDAEAGFALFRDGGWHSGEAFGKVFIEGRQVVGPQSEAIAEPSGGMTVDAAARTAIVSVLEALRAHGLVRPG
ncbi:DUF2793 domain-containing protein [Sphingomonas sp. MMS12-HWE2-04]|uniref:DUF2793 domain-containing protein n=1 Tax=Sphingomonas sp. MMS12-HWE2-04 TaxID=3234199 RepID=UPI00384FA8D0